MILISAGHHESAQGASYTNNGHTVTEYILATKWADLIASILGGKCLRVPNGTLRQKVTFINERMDKHAIAAEIHFNSYKKWKDLNGNGIVDTGELIALGRGSETLYLPKSITGRRAGEIMQHALSQVFKPDRGVKEGYYQMNPKKGPDYFLAQTNCTSLIIEPEFIDNIEKINQGMHAGCHSIASALLDIEVKIFEGLNFK